MSDKKPEKQAPMKEITGDVLENVIELARLDPLAPGMALQKDHLKKILDHFSVLRSVPLDNIEPTIHGNTATLPVRSDDVVNTFSSDDALANARMKSNKFFVAPKILGGGDSDKAGAVD